MRIGICGGHEFIGRHTARIALGDGHEVVEITFGARALGRPAPPAGVRQVRLPLDATSDDLATAMHGCDVIINLVERDMARDRSGARATERIATAAASADVAHLVHLSAIGAAASPQSASLRRHWTAEQSVRRAGVPFTIIRAAHVFGPGDDFFTALTRTIRLARVVAPVIGPGTSLLQPIAVEDLARVLVLAAQTAPRNARIDVGGPEQLTINQIVDVVKAVTGTRRFTVHVPLGAAHKMAAVAERVRPRGSLTRDAVRMAERNTVTRHDAVLTHFGFEPTAFRDGAAYLRDQ